MKSTYSILIVLIFLFVINPYSNTSKAASGPPTITDISAENITGNSAKIYCTVYTNGLTTTSWCEYDISTGVYTFKTTQSTIAGENNVAGVTFNLQELSAGTTYYYRIVATNSAGTTYSSEMSFTTLDTTIPYGSVTINNGNTYTNSTTITLNLSATDDVGVTGYYISNVYLIPSKSDTGWTSVSKTENFNTNTSYTFNGNYANGSTLTIYAWFRDAFGNISNVASDSIMLDEDDPIITILSPTSNSTLTTEDNTIDLEGNAFDSTSSISSVTWENSKGGNGTATGTNNWIISGVYIYSGDNVITVTARDNASNSGIDTITITTPNENGSISGTVIDTKGNPVASAKIKLKGTVTRLKTTSDSDGYFVFTELSEDVYRITATKSGYEKSGQTLSLGKGEDKVEVEIVMEKS